MQNNDKKRVLFVTESLARGGMETVFRESQRGAQLFRPVRESIFQFTAQYAALMRARCGWFRCCPYPLGNVSAVANCSLACQFCRTIVKKSASLVLADFLYSCSCGCSGSFTRPAASDTGRLNAMPLAFFAMSISL